MNTATTVANMAVRVTGAINLALGVLFWTGLGLVLVPLHMLLGLVFVLALWTLCALGARAGLRFSSVAVAFGWSLALPALGVLQAQLFPGSGHWMVRVSHLLIAVVAMAQAQRLATSIAQSPRHATLHQAGA